MTRTGCTASGPGHRRAATRARPRGAHVARRTGPGLRTRLRTRLPVVLLALAGVGLLLFPSAGNWFADRAHARSLSSYATAVEQVPDTARADLLAQARAYNDRIGVQTLTDPYTDVAEVTATAEEYEEQLRLDGSDTMARIRIPTIDVSLPVRHGTSETVLARGVGHLQGSSLPVGGEGTNAVLTGHSGLASARLFTDLHELVIGDLVYVDVLGTTLAYEIDLIETVLPTQTDLLKAQDGADLLTLITCTPVGVNSHRLIVRAHRVELPADAATVDEATAVPTVPFPWWLVAAGLAVAAGLSMVLVPGRRRRSGRRRPARHRAGPGRDAAPDRIPARRLRRRRPSSPFSHSRRVGSRRAPGPRG